MKKQTTCDTGNMQYGYPLCISVPELATAYVPFQCLNCIYPPAMGLKQGTIFPELDRPYKHHAK